ncbi:unnamed protein product, partial [Heterosigma akashiwo]
FKKIPHYSEALKQGSLVQGADISSWKDVKVLFISHRWEQQDHPDPCDSQYAVIRQYILKKKEEGLIFNFIWIDYSCICQPNVQHSLFLKNLANIPTSILMSTHTLVVPRIDQGTHVFII